MQKARGKVRMTAALQPLTALTMTGQVVFCQEQYPGEEKREENELSEVASKEVLTQQQDQTEITETAKQHRTAGQHHS